MTRGALVGKTPEESKIALLSAVDTGKYPTSGFIKSSLFFLNDVPLSPGCAIFRTSDLEKNLMVKIPSPTITDFLSHGAGPDLLLYLLTAEAYEYFAFIDEPLSFFRSHEGSITISDKSGYLFRCYIQARIWFAENHYSPEQLKDFYTNIWYAYCRSTNDWQSPRLFFKSFSRQNKGDTRRHPVSFLCLKAIKKIIRLLKGNDSRQWNLIS